MTIIERLNTGGGAIVGIGACHPTSWDDMFRSVDTTRRG